MSGSDRSSTMHPKRSCSSASQRLGGVHRAANLQLLVGELPGHRVAGHDVVLDDQDPSGSVGRLAMSDSTTRTRSSRVAGLVRYPTAPSASPRLAPSTAETKCTGMRAVAGSKRSSSMTRQPSVSGRRTSRTIPIGCRSRASRRPVWPSEATRQSSPCLRTTSRESLGEPPIVLDDQQHVGPTCAAGVGGGAEGVGWTARRRRARLDDHRRRWRAGLRARDVGRPAQRKRQVQPERAPLPERALDLQLAAQELRQLARDAEPEPGPAVASIDGAVHLLERHEDPLLILGRDAETGVRDRERSPHSPAAGRRRRNRAVAARAASSGARPRRAP